MPATPLNAGVPLGQRRVVRRRGQRDRRRREVDHERVRRTRARVAGGVGLRGLRRVRAGRKRRRAVDRPRSAAARGDARLHRRARGDGAAVDVHRHRCASPVEVARGAVVGRRRVVRPRRRPPAPSSVTTGAVVSTTNVCAALVPVLPAASLCVAWAV